MAGRRPRLHPWLALGVVTALVVGACADSSVRPSGSPTDDARGGLDATSFPSAPPSSGPFVPMVYPVDGPAPCDEDAAADPSHGPYRGTIRRITAVDPLTVTFELCDSDAAFLAKVAAPSLAINDTAWLTARIDPAGGAPRLLTEVNGTGPFRLESWGDGANVTLRRFDGYWGDRARTGALVFVAEGDAGRRLAKLSEGSVDGVDLVAPADAASVVQNPDIVLDPREGLNIAYVGLNNRFAPFDSEAVRQALAIGIDRAAIVSDAFPPGAELATHFLPCAIADGCAGGAWPGLDPALARERLAQAGFPDGFSTSITYSDEPREYLPDPTAVATALQTQLHEYLGVDATLRVLPFDDLVAQADAGRIDGLYLLGARARVPDASLLLDQHFGPASSAQFGRRFDDIARALDQGRATGDPAKRTVAYQRANERIVRHVPMIPLAHVGTLAATRADVGGYTASATASDRFSLVTPGDRAQFVFMQAGRPGGLYCADEVDDAALRICAQLTESLYRLDLPEPTLSPALATACVPDADLVLWTCSLRPGVRFHDGTSLDANDVVLSYAVQWDAEHPLHRGREGSFSAFTDRFGGLLNPPPTP
ncbi:MAG TPA: ABC transporter substrate-binding protein [Candidatus Limnocylindrales bacterium]|nr:ABC transporter substrate-binding protein [Candidatus Limnocylindrales bacterium]